MGCGSARTTQACGAPLTPGLWPGCGPSKVVALLSGFGHREALGAALHWKKQELRKTIRKPISLCNLW